MFHPPPPTDHKVCGHVSLAHVQTLTSSFRPRAHHSLGPRLLLHFHPNPLYDPHTAAPATYSVPPAPPRRPGDGGVVRESLGTEEGQTSGLAGREVKPPVPKEEQEDGIEEERLKRTG